MADSNTYREGTEVNSREWLKELLQEKCHFHEVRDFQLQHGLDLINGRDLFLVIAPGMGKTTVLLAPLLAAQARGESGIGLLVVPTKLLAEQTARVASSRGLRALAINEDTLHKESNRGRNLFTELGTGEDIRLGVMSPWMFVDEVHLLNEDSADWREAYGSIDLIRARLTHTTIWAAVTGTATSENAALIAMKLGFKPGYVNARYTTNRSHIKYITRFMAHAYTGNEFLDAAFTIPPDITSRSDIEPTLYFLETIEQGSRVMAFFDRLLEMALKTDYKDIVKPYNSLLSRSERHDFIADFNRGIIRIGICTDTCTYGLDISSVRCVVVFGLCESFETEKQRLCRAGRDGLPAKAYSIVPEWVREIPEEQIVTVQGKENATRRGKLKEVVRDWHNGALAHCPRKINMEYNDEPFISQENCCSLHAPAPEEDKDQRIVASWVQKLKDQSSGSDSSQKIAVPRSDGTHRALEPHMVASVSRILMDWRGRQWAEIRGDDRDRMAIDFLSDSMLIRIAEKAHICTTLQRLGQVIGTPEWPYLLQYGDQLVAWLALAMSGFDSIFNDRKHPVHAEGDDLYSTEGLSDSDDAMEDTDVDVSMVDATNQAKTPRLKLTIPCKRAQSLEPETLAGQVKRVRYHDIDGKKNEMA